MNFGSVTYCIFEMYENVGDLLLIKQSKFLLKDTNTFESGCSSNLHGYNPFFWPGKGRKLVKQFIAFYAFQSFENLFEMFME